LIDLCTGPHLPSSDRVKGFKVTKNSASQWLGKTDNDKLQRVYAISFPKQKLLDEYVAAQKELEKRDHRNVGPQQNLFNWSPLSPGCAFFYPAGAKLYNNLMNLMRS
jgi:threonyl-tRNA synthetase